MESIVKIKKLKEKITKLQILIEDFSNLYKAKKNKIGNLENDIEIIKQKMNKYIDNLEELIDK